MHSPEPSLLPDSSSQRRPAVWATTALGLGILLDSQAAIAPQIWWIVFGMTGMLTVFLTALGSQPHLQSTLLLALILAGGGLRHQEFVSDRSLHNIQNFAALAPEPVRLRGTIVSSVDIIEAERGPRIPPWMEIDTSRFRLRVAEITSGDQWLAVSGVTQVDLSGHLVHARVGDRIEIMGKLSRPSPVKNPGGFDFARYLERQGIGAICRVNHPQAVRVIPNEDSWMWTIARLRESIREEARALFTQNLSKQSKVIALSLLLGDRSQLNKELRDQFAQAGAMHLLAISGLHVGILAGLIALLCRAMNLSLVSSRLMIVLGVVLFAMLTNHRPPVLRATMLISLLALGSAATRRIDGFNVLAFCAGILLLWKPTDLFDIGAQLSFLAVGAIIWSSAFLRSSPNEEQSKLPVAEGSRWKNALRPVANFAYQGYVITAAIWLATLPLTMTVFNLVSPIGYLLNVLLIPFAAFTLGFGYLFLFAGLIFPSTGPLLSIPFDLLIEALLAIVEWAQSLRFGHFYSSGFSNWWLSGYYILLAMLWRIFEVSPPREKTWKMLAAWIAIGCIVGNYTPPRSGLRYTVLAVGHGLASVVELPDGETILYDAGTFGDGRRAERIVEDYLRSRGITHIDTVIVSHADHDHFSGLFGILERFPVGTVIVSQPFLDFEQSSVKELCELAALKEIPIKIVQAGDELKPSQNSKTNLKVLHPPSQFESKFDNANSIVLEIDYAGRDLLLTGDLEKDGLAELLSLGTSKFNVTVAPHHGSKYSSPKEFFDWAKADHVLISSGDAEVTARLQNELGNEVNVLGTETSGAITVEISSDGELKIIPFLSQSD